MSKNGSTMVYKASKAGLTSQILLTWEKNRWNLQRFGLSPEKVKNRIFGNRDRPRILCICIPKAGTHLLERVLCLHPHFYRKLLPTVNDGNIHRWGGFADLLNSQKPGQILFAHLNFSEEYLNEAKLLNTKVFLLIRDPRDVVVSQAFYVARNKKHYLHDLFVGQDVKTQIMLATAGIPERGYPSIGNRLAKYVGWLESPVCHIIRFEDLRSNEEKRQYKTVQALFEHLKSTIDNQGSQAITQQMITRASPTFRHGMVGQWREYFDSELESFFNDVAGNMLIKYGYSNNEV